MASKAKRRAQALIALTPKVVVPFRRQGDTRTIQRLKTAMQQIATRAQFDRLLLQGAPETREARRKLMEPMLRPNLPCCGTYAVKGPHAAGCPTRRLM